jgi:hypothetical protein
MSRSIQDLIVRFVTAHDPEPVSFAEIRSQLELDPHDAKNDLHFLKRTGRLVYRHGIGYRIPHAPITPTFTGTMLDVLMPRTVERTVRCRKVKGVMA